MGVRQQNFMDYDGFLEKFKPKKTTDDCYTPLNIYEAGKAWAVKEYALEGREIVRPFWPGGDFETFDYPDRCVVIDNPPFSIISRIVKWYAVQGIDYFLFSPYLTNLGIGGGEYGVNHIIAPVSVTYENGARVDTAFVTNMGEWFIRAVPELMDALQEQEDINAKAKTKSLPKYVYPDCVLTSANVGYMCKHHTPFGLRREDCGFIRKLDAQGSKGIFGAGYLLSERAAAERAAAERAAAERLRAEGHFVVNPAELSALFGTAQELCASFMYYYNGFSSDSDSSLARAVMDADLAAVRSCDAIYMLKGWENSRGAKKELAKAIAHGLAVMQEGAEE